MWIMLAGPYSSGNADAQTRAARLAVLNAAALEVFRRGHVPVIGVNMALPVIAAAGATDAAFAEIMMPFRSVIANNLDKLNPVDIQMIAELALRPNVHPPFHVVRQAPLELRVQFLHADRQNRSAFGFIIHCNG